MFQFVIGVIIGLFISMIGASLILVSGSKIDIQVFTNIVIAFATTVAVAIHYDSKRQQRKDRVWDINKDSLLKLSKVVSDSIILAEKLSESEFNHEQGIPDNTKIKGLKEINEKFQDTISDSLNVYKPLLNSELLKAIETYQEEEKNIQEQFNCDAISTFEAHDLQWSKLKKLHTVICSFIKEVSGI